MNTGYRPPPTAMFIPRGTTIHENLATSYVLIDALVDDLCEGGFSGVVDVTLRNADAHIVIDRGKTVVAMERSAGGGYSRVTVADLAAQARGERGRISVQYYSNDAAEALTVRMLARPLYTGLSTEFADLERMLAKLGREPDRRWFVEIRTAGGGGALVDMYGGRLRVITSGEGPLEGQPAQPEVDRLTPGINSVLAALLAECDRAGGLFDVYYATESANDFEPPPAPELLNRSELPARQAEGSGAPGYEIAAQDSARMAAAPARTETIVEAGDASNPPPDLQQAFAEGHTPPEAGAADEAGTPVDPAPLPPQSLEPENPIPGDAAAMTESDMAIGLEDLSLPVDPRQAAEGERFAEIKRLMGDIASAIEVASRVTELKQSFALHLRAGQIKVAERYPFLDPFASEFEYLDGEIAFVGEASPGGFREGLTEALKMALGSLVESSAQPGRLRASINLDLRQYLDQNRAELEKFGLDRSVEELIA